MRSVGTLAFSSGNHVQATTLSAKLPGMSATIVMPHDAPAKVSATKVKASAFYLRNKSCSSL
ncbi:pyridoxal-phosphate dependent enzyme [Enterobacter sp. C6]|nr:pyridoxal-phosphate dependent enzyme [Enterobacter sp. C6]